MNVYVVGRRIVHVRLVEDILKDECYCTHLIAWHRTVNSITELYGALLKLIAEHEVALG